MPYSSYITAVQAVYNALTPASFPSGFTLSQQPLWLDEPPTVGPTGGTERLPPPYVVIRDLSSTAEWTFGGRGSPGKFAGQNAIERGEFVLEAYATDLGVADAIIWAILWNGQIPDARAGLAFATLSLTAPQGGMAGFPMPTRDQRSYSGFKYNNDRVHVSKQWFKVMTRISGDGA